MYILKIYCWSKDLIDLICCSLLHMKSLLYLSSLLVIRLSADLPDNLKFVSSVLFTFIRVTNCLLFLYVSYYKVIIHSVFGQCDFSNLWHRDKYLCSQRPHYGIQCIQFCPGPPTVITGQSWSFNEFISDLTWDSMAQLHT